MYGFGEEKKTPAAFVAACNKFVFVEILKASTNDEGSKPAVQTKQLAPLLRTAVESTAKEDGWAALSAVGSAIQKNDPAFDARNYGFKKLSELVKKQTDLLDVKERPSGEDDDVMHLYVRLR